MPKDKETKRRKPKDKDTQGQNEPNTKCTKDINCVFACLRLYSDKRPKPTPKPKLIHKPTP